MDDPRQQQTHPPFAVVRHGDKWASTGADGAVRRLFATEGEARSDAAVAQSWEMKRQHLVPQEGSAESTKTLPKIALPKEEWPFKGKSVKPVEEWPFQGKPTKPVEEWPVKEIPKDTTATAKMLSDAIRGIASAAASTVKETAAQRVQRRLGQASEHPPKVAAPAAPVPVVTPGPAIGTPAGPAPVATSPAPTIGNLPRVHAARPPIQIRPAQTEQQAAAEPAVKAAATHQDNRYSSLLGQLLQLLMRVLRPGKETGHAGADAGRSNLGEALRLISAMARGGGTQRLLVDLRGDHRQQDQRGVALPGMPAAGATGQGGVHRAWQKFTRFLSGDEKPITSAYGSRRERTRSGERRGYLTEDSPESEGSSGETQDRQPGVLGRGLIRGLYRAVGSKTGREVVKLGLRAGSEILGGGAGRAAGTAVGRTATGMAGRAAARVATGAAGRTAGRAAAGTVGRVAAGAAVRAGASGLGALMSGAGMAAAGTALATVGTVVSAVGAVVGLGVAAVGVTYAINAWGKHLISSQEHLAKWSGGIATSLAQFQLGETRREIATARGNAQSFGFNARQTGRLADQLRPLDEGIDKFSNMVSGAIQGAAASVLEATGFKEFAEAVNKHLDELARAAGVQAADMRRPYHDFIRDMANGNIGAQRKAPRVKQQS